MTSDQITISRLTDLRAILDTAADTVARLERDARLEHEDGTGSISPAEAAAILNETLANINAAFR